MSAEKPIITIVVPAFNVERFITECLESLLNQTHKHHRIIVVNDGSTDATGTIAEYYAQKYPDMIMLVNQENKGLGAARNAGLALVGTPYVTFLDSDDWQECHFVEELEGALSEHDEMPDVIFTLPWCYDSVTHAVYEWADKMMLEQLFYPYGGRENTASCEITKNDPNWMKMYLLQASACRRIYRTAFLREIHFSFPVGVKWEDVWPHFNVIHNAKRCVGLRSTGFLYRLNTASQITSGGGASRLDIVTVFTKVLQEAQKNNWSTEEIAYIVDMFRDFSAWSVRVTNSEYIFPLLKNLHEAFRMIPRSYIKDSVSVCGRPQFDLFYMYLLRSPFYGVFADYRKRTKYKKYFQKIKRILGRV